MQKKKQGISLIVLVITIIVMIILAAAIIISLQNNGIINRASTAVKAYNEDEVSHMASLAWSEAYLNPAITTDEQYAAAVNTALTNQGVDTSKYLIIVTTSGVTVKDKSNIIWVQDGVNITNGVVTLEAGDLIQYNAGVGGYEGDWRVLGAEDGNLLVMSTEDVGTLTLHGLEGDGSTTNYGLLNGVSILNTICEVYGSGTGAVGGRSIKAEDVDKLTNYNKTTYGLNEIFQYGNKVTYSWHGTDAGKVNYTSTNGENGTLETTHSNGFTYVDYNTMEETTVLVGQTGIPTITSTYYTFNKNEALSKEAKNMLFGVSSNFVYWLASPEVATTGNKVLFMLAFIADGNKISYDLFHSDGYESAQTIAVRAVVKLSPNIIIGEKDNNLGWSYTV